MITKAIHPELLDQLPTLQKALANEKQKDEELKLAQNELDNTQHKLDDAENQIAMLKAKLKEHNIEVD